MTARWELLQGDCLEVMRTLPDGSFDSVITDPPYELGFMNKVWDSTGVAFNVKVWRQCRRLLKPGGYLLSFGGTRTYHRMACAVADAGFEIKDMIQWIYGDGWPKSFDVSKAIDKAADAERQIIAPKPYTDNKALRGNKYGAGGYGRVQGYYTAAATAEAKQWEGWGTALKPACEPICLARKRLSERTVVQNVLKWGTGALNIDDCRVNYEAGGTEVSSPSLKEHITGGNGGHIFSHEDKRRTVLPHRLGRWPANVILDEEAGAMLDAQSGTLKSGANPRRRGPAKNKACYSAFAGQEECEPARGVDIGGASRFFYCAKAAKKERGVGAGFPTIKPLALMRHLCRLVTPPGGRILDPFAGTGSTLIAAVQEGFDVVGIELYPETCDTARARLAENLDGQPTLFEAAAEAAAAGEES